MATKKLNFGDFVSQNISNKLEAAEQEGKKHKEALAVVEKVQGYKKPGRKLQAGEKRTEKVFVSFSPTEYAKVQEIMLLSGRQYQAVAEFIRESVLNQNT